MEDIGFPIRIGWSIESAVVVGFFLLPESRGIRIGLHRGTNPTVGWYLTVSVSRRLDVILLTFG